MSKSKRTLRFGLLLALIAGLVPGAGGRALHTNAAVVPNAVIPPQLVQAAGDAAKSGDGYVDVDFLVSTGPDQARLDAAIDAAGGHVLVQTESYIRAHVPAAAASALPKTEGVRGVGVNQALSIDPTQLDPSGKQLGPGKAQELIRTNFAPVGIDAFRDEFGVNGRGITVAVVDTGVDPGHPDLLQTPDGRPKISDWKDFTGEGLVNTATEVPWAATYTTADGRQYELPDPPEGSRAAHFGFLDEQYVNGYINQDLDRNGLQIDRFGVLVVDSRQPGMYDTVYVDTNNDGSFRDEQPLTVYREGHAYGSLGQYREGDRARGRVNFVVSDIDPAGRRASLGFDGNGHGTWVSGIVGASNPDGLTGAAPGVQIMALKALHSTGGGEWFRIKEAIEYAASHGASIINVSVGNLATGAAKEFDSGASEWLDQIAAKYGVLIVLAAGNSGPGLSSGDTLGNPSSVLAIGAYFSPEMWLRDYNGVVPHESIWFFSGMGPRSDGTYLPNVVAPGGSPTTSPLWRDLSGYTTVDGTSVATPHVSGAAALLMEAGRKAGISSDWLSVKRALEMGARRVPGFEVYEQGSGLIQLRAAYSHLEQITASPVLEATTLDGKGGLLARSYEPGSSSFYLTNMDPDLSRVTIYSSEPWVRPAFTSLLLPPQTVRQLPVSIDPPQEEGAHSAFLMVNHQHKYGPSLMLPITHVQPLSLNQANEYSYSTDQALEAGRYRRYFFNVVPGMTNLTVTARVPVTTPGGGSGTVQVHVFRPDGQPVHAGKIGVAGDGLTSLFQTSDPVAGTWEVVVVALPDSQSANENPEFALNVKAAPGAVNVSALRFSVPAGSVTTQQVKVSNVFPAFTGRVDALGLFPINATNPWYLSVPWREKSLGIVETFSLKEFTSDLRIEVDNPVRGDLNIPDLGNTDLSLYLYRSDASGGWALYRQSITPGSNHEVIALSYVPAGTYQVFVTSGNDYSLRFQYRRLMGVDEFGLQVPDEARRYSAGETWTTNLTIKAPNEPGRYAGSLVIRDTDQKKVLAWYPVEVSVGQPTLAIEPMTAQLAKGRPSTVVLDIRDSRSGKAVSGISITVNGQRFLSLNGQISVPVLPEGNTQVLQVEADVPAYQFVKTQFTLPVKDAWGPYPIGGDGNQENQSWRRKVTTQLP